MVSTPVPDSSPPVVVCVDDDPQVLSAVQRLLRREPYELLTTEKPETALRWLVERGVGLLITDLRMPDMDGSDLVKVVEERFPETASLILTGYPDLAPTRTGPRLIAKPWDDAELKDAIRALLLGRAVPREIVGFRPQPGEDKGRLLVVAEDPRVRGRAGAAAPAERFDVHVALHPDEGLRLIKDLHPAVEVVVVDSRITVWPLRQALPDATIIVLAEAPSSEEIRRWYDMGIEQVLRLSVSTNALSAAVHHCVLRVREQRKDARRRAIERSRRAADPWWKRGGRTVLGWMRAPARSRVGERRILLGFSAA
ncbi:MAG TPA: response regulator, partial [Planctomycetota bacterium]|nr:response regulator [Planctomycetota bacterium]